MLLTGGLNRKNYSVLSRFFVGNSKTSLWSVQMLRNSSILISLLGGFALLLFCLVPGAFCADGPEGPPVRSIEIIDTDNLGVEFDFPSTIYYDAEADEIYITNAGRNKVVICASDYFPQISVGKGRGASHALSAFVKDNKVYFCISASKDNLHGYIAVYNRALMPLRKIFVSGVPGVDHFQPRKLVVGENGLFYVIGGNTTELMVLDQNGTFLRKISPQENVLGVPEEASVRSISLGKDGRLYVLSESHGRIYVYDKNEEFLFKFGKKGGSSGKLSRPRGIAVDTLRDRVYVVDYMRHTINVYSDRGEFLFEFGGMGNGRGWFFHPTDAIVDGRGNVLVTDTFNNRVQVFKIVDPVNEALPGA